ncbi:MAG: 3-coathanger stack domain-containing protein [Ferruginibacter sp.]
MKSSILFLLMILFAVTGIAQIGENTELKNLLQNKTTFKEIKSTVEGFYRQKLSLLAPADSIQKKKISRERKFWNRYLYDAESHLLPDGRIADAGRKTLDAIDNGVIPSNNLIETVGGAWSLAGPTSASGGVGRINKIAFEPGSATVIYAGSSGGGLFRSSNAGITWSNVNSFLPSLGISGIVVVNSNTLYVLTGDGDANSNEGFTFKSGYIRYSAGVLKSTDAGSSWQRTADFPGITTNYCGMNLVSDPNNSNILLAATTQGLYRTSNGGATWSLCDIGLSGPSDDRVMVYDVKFTPGNSSLAYCTIRNGDNTNDGRFLRSTNGGISFSFNNSVIFNPAFSNIQRIGIAVTPAKPGNVYLLAGPGDPAAGTFKGLWLSTDYGANFNRLSSTPNILGAPETPYDQNLYDLCLAVSLTNDNLVLTGGQVIFRSTSSGAIFTQQTDYFGGSVHPDVHALEYNPANGYLYAGTDGGVSYSTDNGSTWSRIYSGLSCTQFYHFGIQDDGGDIWGGAQDNGILIKNGSSSSFNNYAGGDGYDVLTDLAPAGNQNDKYYSINKEIYADGIINLTITPPGSDNYFANLAMSPVNEDIIYAGYKQLYVSTNRGGDWTEIKTSDIPHVSIGGNWCISSCPTNDTRLYSAGDNGLWRIDNLNSPVPNTTTYLNDGLYAAGYDGVQKITDIFVSENTSNRLWVTIGGYHDSDKVFYSNNAGSTWTNIGKDLPNLPVNSVVADGSDNVYIGTDIAVYYRGASHNKWSPFYNNLPRVAVSELELTAPIGGVYFVHASTYGRGIWISQNFTECPSTLDINSDQQGQRFYQAGTEITSNAAVIGGATTDVAFRAGESLTLYEGFIVNPGGVFRAYIGNCNSGTALARTLNGDSIINFINNIKAAREYGFVDDAVSKGPNIEANFHIFSAGNYIIRVFDVNTHIYVSEWKSTLVKGINKEVFPLKEEWGKYLRIDLFKEDMLVHYHDFEKK